MIPLLRALDDELVPRAKLCVRAREVAAQNGEGALHLMSVDRARLGRHAIPRLLERAANGFDRLPGAKERVRQAAIRERRIRVDGDPAARGGDGVRALALGGLQLLELEEARRRDAGRPEA